jgi:hypothetical protein
MVSIGIAMQHRITAEVLPCGPSRDFLDIAKCRRTKEACVLETKITLTGIEVNLLVRVLRRELQGTLLNQTAIDLTRVIGKLDRAAIDPTEKASSGEMMRLR